MTWLEASWGHVALFCAAWTAAAAIIVPLFTRGLGRLNVPAGDEGPAAPPRTALDSPLPGHNHGGLDMTIRLYRCGCIHYIGRRHELVDVMPCGAEPLDWDEWLKGLAS